MTIVSAGAGNLLAMLVTLSPVLDMTLTCGTNSVLCLPPRDERERPKPPIDPFEKEIEDEIVFLERIASAKKWHDRPAYAEASADRQDDTYLIVDDEDIL